MVTEKQTKFYKRHLLFICGFSNEDLINLSSDEIYKLYLKHKI
jgi:hypothetical protein